jgi:DNA-binding Lrp family transcriptional regulator
VEKLAEKGLIKSVKHYWNARCKVANLTAYYNIICARKCKEKVKLFVPLEKEWCNMKKH